MFALKLILTSVIVAGVVMAFAGLVVDGKKHIVTSFDEKILDDMCDPPWWV